MTKYINIIFNQLLFYLFIVIIYPCTNCSIPIANAGDDFDVINGGVGILDGTTSYDPDDFELELMYFWYSEDNIISYCGDIDECSGERYYCEGYENVYLYAGGMLLWRKKGYFRQIRFEGLQKELNNITFFV